MTDAARAGENVPLSGHRTIRRTLRGVVLESVALVLEFGGLMGGRRESHALAIPAERQVAAPPYRAILRATVAVLVVISISAAVLVAPVDYQSLGDWNYLGVFLVTLVATGALVVPVPYLVLIAQVSRFETPLLVALAAGVAAALGELTGYLIGFGSRELLPANRWERAAERWMQRHGFLSIAVFAFIPNPAFDAAGIAAGALRYAVWKFVLACFLGKTAKFMLIALFGADVLTSLLAFMRQGL